MNLYLLTQDENRGYDTYDSMVVAARSEKEAKQIPPYSNYNWDSSYCEWASAPDNVNAKLIGVSYEDESRVILASFNAG